MGAGPEHVQNPVHGQAQVLFVSNISFMVTAFTVNVGEFVCFYQLKCYYNVAFFLTFLKFDFDRYTNFIIGATVLDFEQLLVQKGG